MRWHILTGEYPPQPGGVSDYTRVVAGGLAEAGDEVHVWAPACGGASVEDRSVSVHRLPGRFGLRALIRLDAALRQETRPYDLLVEYVPHMYGYKAMNLALCAWLRFLCPVRPWVMIHEVAFPIGRRQPVRYNILGCITRLMARLVAASADRVFVSIPTWGEQVGRWTRPSAEVVWLPVPSNIPTEPRLEVVHDAAQRYRKKESLVIGHFGTYGEEIAASLRLILPRLLKADEERLLLLIGRGGREFARDLVERFPELDRRVIAPGELSAVDVAAHLCVCDLLVQPYPDGASSRRGSLMAGLALGLPIITTYGPLSEPLWRDEQLVAAATVDDVEGFVDIAERLLSDSVTREELGRRAAEGYSRHFSVAHTVRILRGAEDSSDSTYKLRPACAEQPPVSPWESLPDEVNS